MNKTMSSNKPNNAKIDKNQLSKLSFSGNIYSKSANKIPSITELRPITTKKLFDDEYDDDDKNTDHGLHLKKILKYQKHKQEFEIQYKKFLKFVTDSINIIKAVMMRLVFSLHSLIAIFYVYIVKQDEWYFLNTIGVVFLLIELFVTIIKRRGKEPTWFFPCFFIYICTMIPPLWFVELTRINNNNNRRQRMHANSTHISYHENDEIIDLSGALGFDDSLINDNNISLDAETIAVYLEISLLILIILGRWFLPKGNISRSALSQLLLVYMSLGSDMIDLLSLLNETNVQESHIMTYFTLGIFSWSLIQFSLNLVVSRGRSFQSVISEDILEPSQEFDDDLEEIDDENATKSFIEKLNKHIKYNSIKEKFNSKSNGSNRKKGFCSGRTSCFRFDLLDSEMWSILITLIFQDGPFLALRLTAVFKFKVRTFITLFYTCKNAIILFLQFYRLSAIYTEANKEHEITIDSNKADVLASLNMITSQLDKFVMLTYTQNLLINSKKSNLNSKACKDFALEEGEKTLLAVNPLILRSSLSKSHSYTVMLTPSYSLNNLQLSSTGYQPRSDKEISNSLL